MDSIDMTKLERGPPHRAPAEEESPEEMLRAPGWVWYEYVLLVLWCALLALWLTIFFSLG